MLSQTTLEAFEATMQKKAGVKDKVIQGYKKLQETLSPRLYEEAPLTDKLLDLLTRKKLHKTLPVYPLDVMHHAGAPLGAVAGGGLGAIAGAVAGEEGEKGSAALKGALAGSLLGAPLGHVGIKKLQSHLTEREMLKALDGMIPSLVPSTVRGAAGNALAFANLKKVGVI